MRVMTPHSIPVFLGNAGIGLPHGMVPPQIRGFDVYYKTPILVGFHVLGNPDNLYPEISFLPYDNPEELGPQILGFYAYQSGIEECCENGGFTVTIREDDNAPKVVGFYAYGSREEDLAISWVLNDTVGPNDAKVLGFYVAGVI